MQIHLWRAYGVQLLMRSIPSYIEDPQLEIACTEPGARDGILHEEEQLK